MRKRGIVLSVVALLAAATAVAADKRVHQTVSLAASGSVSIDTHNGTITVTAWNQPSVDVTARIEQGLFISDGDVRKTEVRVTGSGENVRIESDYSAIMSRFFWLGNEHNLPSVHYTLFMPATARLTVDDWVVRLEGSFTVGDDEECGAVSAEARDLQVAGIFTNVRIVKRADRVRLIQRAIVKHVVENHGNTQRPDLHGLCGTVGQRKT